MPAEVLKVGGPGGVAFLAVLTAIGFDDQLALDACEVSDEWSDRLLLPELEAAMAAIAEMMPETLLGIGFLAAQAAGMWVDLADRGHGTIVEEGRPSPNPLPHAGEG